MYISFLCRIFTPRRSARRETAIGARFRVAIIVTPFYGSPPISGAESQPDAQRPHHITPKQCSDAAGASDGSLTFAANPATALTEVAPARLSPSMCWRARSAKMSRERHRSDRFGRQRLQSTRRRNWSGAAAGAAVSYCSHTSSAEQRFEVD
jgi:hypothetical protein